MLGVMSDPAVPVPTPRCRRVLAAAEQAARDQSHPHLGVEHLFLAIIRDRDAVPTQVLSEFGDPAAVEAALLALMNSASYRTASGDVVFPGGGDA